MENQHANDASKNKDDGRAHVEPEKYKKKVGERGSGGGRFEGVVGACF